MTTNPFATNSNPFATTPMVTNNPFSSNITQPTPFGQTTFSNPQLNVTLNVGVQPFASQQPNPFATNSSNPFQQQTTITSTNPFAANTNPFK